jgi:hypothetical protein
MAHSVPLKTEPTTAKLRPEDSDERYMSRRPCFSCWRRGRSVRGTLPGRVAAAADGVGAVVTLGCAADRRVDEAVEEAVVEAVAVDVAVVVAAAPDAGAVADGLGTAFTGRGCDMGVSYRIWRSDQSIISFSWSCTKQCSAVRSSVDIPMP